MLIGFLGLCVRLAKVVLANLITPVGNDSKVRLDSIETLYTLLGIVETDSGLSLMIGDIFRNL